MRLIDGEDFIKDEAMAWIRMMGGNSCMTTFYTRCDFRGMDFSEQNLSDCHFTRCHMEYIKLPRDKKRIQNTTFYECYFGEKYDPSEVYVQPFYEAGYRLKIRVTQRRSIIRGNTVTTIYSDDIIARVSARDIAGPDSDTYTGYKIVMVRNENSGKEAYALAVLSVSVNEPCMLFPGTKCRAYRARVLEIRDKDGQSYQTAMNDFYSTDMAYVVGEEVVADSWDDRIKRCTHGIHFFLTEQEAWHYVGHF